MKLRKNIHNELFNNFDKIDIKNNFIYRQYEALLSFKKNKSFTIIDCDKNVGSAIISNDLYNDSVLNYLNTDPAYRELDHDPLANTVNLINNTLNDQRNFIRSSVTL